MTRVNNCSFKGYIPVQYYAKHPRTAEYVPVLKKDNIKKCQSFVVRNLNRTAKNKNQEFINQFKEQDKDYRSVPVVKSVYDDRYPTVLLVTGSDVDTINNLAKPVGKAKRDSIETMGNTNTAISKNAAKDYFKNVKYFLLRCGKRIKDTKGNPLRMEVFFNPIYNKRNELKGFEYVKTSFVKDID